MGEKRQEVLDEKGEEPGVTLGWEKTPGSAKRKGRGTWGRGGHADGGKTPGSARRKGERPGVEGTTQEGYQPQKSRDLQR